MRLECSNLGKETGEELLKTIRRGLLGYAEMSGGRRFDLLWIRDIGTVTELIERFRCQGWYTLEHDVMLCSKGSRRKARKPSMTCARA
jgi:hypothetical protein